MSDANDTDRISLPCGSVISRVLPPEDGLFPTQSVEGEFGITAVLAPFDRILDYQEKRGLPAQGYFRLVRHPYIRELEACLCSHTGLGHAVCFGSYEMALYEMFDYLFAERGYSGLTHDGAASLEVDRVLTALRIPRRPGAELQLAPLHQLPTVRAAYLAYTDHVPAAGDVPADCEAVVANLVDVESDLQGGVVLFRSGEEAARFWDRARKRGGTLSARNAAIFLGHHFTRPESKAAEEVVRQLCIWEKADHGFLYPSGMAALAQVLDLFLTPARNHITVVGHLYSDTHVILAELASACGPIESTFLRTEPPEAVEDAITSKTAAVLVETITNPLCEIPNLPWIIAAARQHGIPVLVDNTMATPVNCRPLELGADLVLHSTSKYLSGGNDHGGGAVLCRDLDLARRLARQQEQLNSRMSPLECMVLRDRMQNFPERMQRFNHNGQQAADFLRGHDRVGEVFYNQGGRGAVHLEGAGSVVSFLLTDPSLEAVVRFYDALGEPVLRAPSLGSDKTLLCPYVLLTYYHRDEEYLKEIRLPRHLIRLAAGCEEDLEPVLQALKKALEAG